MKKKKSRQIEGNVVLFPEVEKRLAERGLERLKEKKYTEAISLLESAVDIDNENEEIKLGLVLALIEAGELARAKQLTEEMLKQGMGHYEQVVELHITILLQLHDFATIVTTIEALLEENSVSAEKVDHFYAILEFSRRNVENFSIEGEHEVEEFAAERVEDPDTRLDLLSLDDHNLQMQLVSLLANRNLTPFMAEIREYLSDPEGQPFLKTLLLTLLQDQEYEKVLSLWKFGSKEDVIPVNLPDIREQPKMKEIIAILSEALEQKDPILLENCKSLVERHFFITYPMALEPEESRAWAAAFHFLTLKYYGVDPKLKEVAKRYEQSVPKIEQAIEWIKRIEEISYPSI